MRTEGLATFFLDLGLGEVFHQGTPGTCLSEGIGVGGFRLGSPAEEASTLVAGLFNSFARALARMDRHGVLYTQVRTTTTTTTTDREVGNTSVLKHTTTSVFVCNPSGRSMEGARGTAARRRENRLRCFWRHVQLSLKMALAADGHHSAQPRAKEVEERELHHAPRRQKPDAASQSG